MTAPTPPPIRRVAASARSTDVFGRVLCRARHHHFVIDGPVTNGCPGEALTPPEAFLAAVAACGVELVHVIARDTGEAAGGVSVEIEGTIDRSRQPREDVTVFTSVRMDFTLAGTDDAAAARLVEGFKRR